MLNAHTGNEHCFLCGKKITEDEHCWVFRGTSSDGSGYTNIYLHSPLCVLEMMMISMKDSRFSIYSEKYKLSTIPRTLDAEHLKIEEWRNPKNK